MGRSGLRLAAAAAAFLSAAILHGQTCAPTSTRLCLAGQRFSAEVSWTDFQGNTGSGQAVRLTADTGYFWFFSSTNVELVVKVLDGRAITGHFWVFYGALSNVRYTMVVRDLQTGDVRIYENPSGQFASVGDTSAFPPDTLPAAARRVSSVRAPGALVPNYSALRRMEPSEAAACVPGATALCLGGGRFRVAAAWKDFAGNTGVGQAVSLTTDTGYFWFFSSSNVEVVIKALDGRVLNDHFWVFYGALSNVEYTLTVTDTVTGIVRTYRNPSGLFASVGDVAAFGKPTTLELIDGAVVKGEITDEIALLYKVYAFFGDARLPAAYTGDPPSSDDHGILFEAANRWPALSSATRLALRPFFTPPIYSDSWFASSASASVEPGVMRPAGVRADWTRIDTTHTAVWYRPADAGAAAAAANVVAEIEKIWGAETSLMQRAPVGDGTFSVANGGDGKFDIYLLPHFSAGSLRDPDGTPQTYPDQDPSAPRAVSLLLRIAAVSTVEGAREVTAHEFFHAIAGAYPNGFNGWLNEATATWMEDYVYPTSIRNLEQLNAVRYLSSGFSKPYDQQDYFGYPSYLFLFYLSHSIPSAPAGDVIRQIWQVAGSTGRAQEMNTAIPGGFKELWPEFAVRCWNQPDVDDFHRQDALTAGLPAGLAEPYLLLDHDNGEGVPLPGRSVPHLAMKYTFIEVDPQPVKRVEIRPQNPASNIGSAKAQAWIQLADGTTRIEDWTSKDRVVFCRDKATENVTKLLILYTNSGLEGDIVWTEGKVIADEVGCGGFRGTVRESRHGTTPDGTTASESMDVTARFLPHPLLANTFFLAQISMRYALTASNSFTGCTLTVDPVTQSESFAGYDGIQQIVFDRSTQPPSYSASGNWGFIASARGECNGQPGGTVPTGVGGEWWKVPPGFFRVNADGSLSGDYSESAGGAQFKWIWNLRPD